MKHLNHLLNEEEFQVFEEEFISEMKKLKKVNKEQLKDFLEKEKNWFNEEEERRGLHSEEKLKLFLVEMIFIMGGDHIKFKDVKKTELNTILNKKVRFKPWSFHKRGIRENAFSMEITEEEEERKEKEWTSVDFIIKEIQTLIDILSKLNQTLFQTLKDRNKTIIQSILNSEISKQFNVHFDESLEEYVYDRTRKITRKKLEDHFQFMEILLYLRIFSRGATETEQLFNDLALFIPGYEKKMRDNNIHLSGEPNEYVVGIQNLNLEHYIRLVYGPQENLNLLMERTSKKKLRVPENLKTLLSLTHQLHSSRFFAGKGPAKEAQKKMQQLFPQVEIEEEEDEGEEEEDEGEEEEDEGEEEEIEIKIPPFKERALNQFFSFSKKSFNCSLFTFFNFFISEMNSSSKT